MDKQKAQAIFHSGKRVVPKEHSWNCTLDKVKCAENDVFAKKEVNENSLS